MNPNEIARIGSLIGDPARAAMLIALMDGQALTATELSRCANITAQTASSHLAKLVAAGLLKVSRQGRHRYHRIANLETARLIESIMQIARHENALVPRVVTGPRDLAMRRARTCYDHLAGSLGVAITDSMIATGMLSFDDEQGEVTDRGIDFLERVGVLRVRDLGSSRRAHRPLCRPCLDWSVRRPHVAGTTGAAICTYFLHNKLVRRVKGSRALEVTASGDRALFDIFGIRRLD